MDTKSLLISGAIFAIVVLLAVWRWRRRRTTIVTLRAGASLHSHEIVGTTIIVGDHYRTVTDYDPATNTATIEDWSSVPSGTNTYRIIKTPQKLAFALLLLAAPASAQNLIIEIPADAHLTQGAGLPPETGMGGQARVMMLAGQGLDVATMAYALRDPRFREGNPLGEVGIYAVKAGLLVGVPWLLKRLGATRKQLDGIGYAFGAIGAGAGVWNISQIRKAGR